jgi:hypothetical protein
MAGFDLTTEARSGGDTLRHYRLFQHALIREVFDRIPIAYVGSDAVLLGLRQDCLSILGQSLSSRPSRLHWMRHPMPMLISLHPG